MVFIYLSEILTRTRVFSCDCITMNQRDKVEAIINALVVKMQSGNERARIAYTDLIHIYNVWFCDRTHDNWIEVIYAAQVAIDSISYQEGEAVN